uniref:Uncharacterized protein n=1 Tax=Trichogramma kaykai TaxID=54128 RepID=A0ABD2XKA8_9HYME
MFRKCVYTCARQLPAGYGRYNGAAERTYAHDRGAANIYIAHPRLVESTLSAVGSSAHLCLAYTYSRTRFCLVSINDDSSHGVARI